MSDDAELQAGAARVSITPQVGCALAGSLVERHAEAIHDPLYVRAVALGDPHCRAAIVAVDLLTVTGQMWQEASAALQDDIGLPEGGLLLGASHTHSAPPIDPRIGWPVDEQYVQSVGEAIVEAVRDAWDGRQAVHPIAATAEEESVARNSRLLLKDGTISWHYPTDDEIADTTGPMDPEVSALAFVADEDERVATVFSYGLHANVGRAGHGAEVSADYPGIAAARLSDQFGGRAMYLQTCCGNVHTTRYGEADYVGEQIAWRVAEALEDADEEAPATFAVASTAMELPIRDIPAAHLREIHDYCDRLYRGEGREEIKEYFQRHADYVRKLKRKEGCLRVRLQAMRIGDAAIVAVPAEMFVELSMEIKERSPAALTMCLGCCNDFIFYVPTPRAYNEEGGYQCFNGIVSPLAGQVIVEAADELLGELFAGDET